MKGVISGKPRIELRKHLQSTTDAQVCRHCGVLLSLSEGHSVNEVAGEFGVTRQTLYNWRHLCGTLRHSLPAAVWSLGRKWRSTKTLQGDHRIRSFERGEISLRRKDTEKIGGNITGLLPCLRGSVRTNNSNVAPPTRPESEKYIEHRRRILVRQI